MLVNSLGIITLCPHLKSVAKNIMGVSWGAEGWGGFDLHL